VLSTTKPYEAEMIEIYADFNDIAADGALPLTCAGSRASIARLTQELAEGTVVRLSDGELMAVATVHRLDDGTWEARSECRFRSVDA
jgi:hypothetical protein